MQNMDRNTRETDQEKDQNYKGMIKHGLMMMLCCLIPILLIAGLPLFGIKGGVSSGLIFLLCPLMHIGMMFMMRKGDHKGSFHGNDEDENMEADSK